MAKKRLTQEMRQHLKTYAYKAVKATVSSEKVDAAYEDVATRVRAIIDRDFPPKDMKLLKKYKVARTDHCIRLVNSGGGIESFTFRSNDDRAPTLPYLSCSSRGFVMDEETQKALSTLRKLKDERKKVMEETFEPYKSLIMSSRYAEDVIEVWPASKRVLEPYMQGTSTALVSLTEAQKEAIKRTNIAVPAQ